MNCFNKKLRRTSPMHGSSKNELAPSKPPRMNGWSWPPQAYQVVGWLVYSYLGIVSFGIYIPLLPPPWNHVHYLNPDSLRTAPQFHNLLGNSTWLVFLPLAPIKTSSAGLLILAFVTAMLSIACLLLLAHLLGFHFYLFFKGISTAKIPPLTVSQHYHRVQVELSNSKSRMPDIEEAQSGVVTSAHRVPGVQDPLGSAVMTPDDT
ncbi:hypothetical protein F7725_018548 [Dissostichus mawsoni]|uniref:Uncharacterized protein n=1 Tax=Dissostichus mawsoni TaxID=36200 RepID=A0A7J5XSI2_DISMA|nr:hypothetical protein F7725_018548 [Dissostichus mawsoni]